MKNIIKPRIPSGFVEYLPDEQRHFDFLLNQIKQSYALFGYANIDTPVLELADVLLSNSGGETEKQVYRFTKGSTDYAMRYDLTVPFSRYAVQHVNDLSFPFRRSQVQKVWRAEKAQKGRLREFFQCDVDVISQEYHLFYDAEVITIAVTTLSKILNNKFTVRINSRKLVNAILTNLNTLNHLEAILSVVDKMDKLPIEQIKLDILNVVQEESLAETIIKVFQINGSLDDITEEIKKLGFYNTQIEQELEELHKLNNYLSQNQFDKASVIFDLSIVRGLAYYTGVIFETRVDSFPEVGSICSGGRYDNLCGNFTKVNLTGTGASIGISRIFAVFKDTNVLVTDNINNRIVVIPVSEEENTHANIIANRLRELGHYTEILVGKSSVGSRLKLSATKGYLRAVIIGNDEVNSQTITVKNFNTKTQKTLKLSEISRESLY